VTSGAEFCSRVVLLLELVISIVTLVSAVAATLPLGRRKFVLLGVTRPALAVQPALEQDRGCRAIDSLPSLTAVRALLAQPGMGFDRGQPLVNQLDSGARPLGELLRASQASGRDASSSFECLICATCKIGYLPRESYILATSGALALTVCAGSAQN